MKNYACSKREIDSACLGDKGVAHVILHKSEKSCININANKTANFFEYLNRSSIHDLGNYYL